MTAPIHVLTSLPGNQEIRRRPMTKLLACSLVLGLILLGNGTNAVAENLPVSVDRYSQACVRAGGGVTKAINAGSGKLNCALESAPADPL